MKALKNYTKIIAGLTSAALIFTACNKDLDRFPEPILPSFAASTTNIAASLAANPNDSLFNRLLIRSGLSGLLADSSRKFTVFATDNLGMRLFVNQASGGAVPVAASDAIHSGFIANTLPAATAAAIVQHLTIGQVYTSASFPTGAPNFPITTLFQLDPVNTPFLRMTLCVDKGTPVSYVNNVQILAVDQAASNGVIHKTAFLVTPPTVMVKNLIAADPTLTYFAAAVQRGDVGQTGTGRLDSLMNFPVLNMTVLAPNNTAMITAYTGLVYGQAYPQVYQAIYNQAITNGATPAQATALATANAPAQTNATIAPTVALINSSPTTAAGLFPSASVRGIVAYHMLARDTGSKTTPTVRVFGNNLAEAPALSSVNTLVNGSIALHPGIRASATYANTPFPGTLMGATFRGLGPLQNPDGTTNAPFAGQPAANVVAANRNAVNGVLHVIDRVLLPQ
jgi:Fasciclin domain